MARHRTLDQVVTDALGVLEGTPTAAVLHQFQARYLDLTPARQILNSWVANEPR